MSRAAAMNLANVNKRLLHRHMCLPFSDCGFSSYILLILLDLPGSFSRFFAFDRPFSAFYCAVGVPL